MAHRLPAPLVGVLTLLLLSASLSLWASLIILAGLLKLLLPTAPLRAACTRTTLLFARCWVRSNRAVFRLLHAPRWQLRLRGRLDPRRSYLLIANHRSWADIIVLCDLFDGRAPFPRFFVKRELLYVPLLGAACWAVDMPFMRRHSAEAVARNPALRRQDIETTRRVCEKYREQPVTIVNFVEGTRFDPAKQARHGQGFRHLLRPKSGGLAFALAALAEHLDGLIDATIAYAPTGGHSVLWSFLCGRQNDLIVEAEALPIDTGHMVGDYEGDPAFRAAFQAWINERWQIKDERLERLGRELAARVGTLSDSAPQNR